MADLGTAFIKILPNTKTFGKDLERDVTGKGGSAFKKLGVIAGGALGALAVGKVFKDAIVVASDLNESVAATGEVFGAAADQVTDAAAQMAKDFGVPRKAFLDGAQAIGSIGKASGLTQKAAADLGTDFTKLAADVSSFKNIPLSEALGAIQSGLVGEAEPLRRFGVLLSDAAVKAEASRLGLTKLGGELTEQQKVQARSSLITKGLADASGDLARTQDSAANQARKAAGAFQEVQAQIGTALLPAVNALLPILVSLAPIIGDVLATAVKALAPLLAAVAKQLGPVLQTVIKALAPVIEDLAPVIGEVALALGETLIALVPLIPPLAKILIAALKLSPAFAKIITVLVKLIVPILTPMVDIIGDLAGVISGLLVRGLGLLRDLLGKLLGPFKAFGKILSTIGGGIKKGLDFLLPGSPPPLVEGLKASAAALKSFQSLAKRTTLPGFTSGVPSFAGAPGFASTRGFSGSITVNQVANDPEATARAVAARLGQRSTR